MVVIDLLHAHPGLREADRLEITPVGLLDVLPQGELDEGIGVLDLHLLRGHAPTELDDAALTANWVGRPV